MNALFNSLSSLPVHIGWLSVVLALFLAYVGFFMMMTSHNEAELIRGGDVNTTVALMGSLLGAALPLFALVRVSAKIGDLIVWGLIILILQFVVYKACKWFLRYPPYEKLSGALFSSGMAVCFGLLNASLFY